MTDMDGFDISKMRLRPEDTIFLKLPFEANVASGGSGRVSPETFSPTGKSASVGLNSKWLYQRGKSRASGGLY